ncbi:Peptidyl-prolyl cis-trans isomerase pin4 [Tieghemiomyces parasiticus]|uniref:Peptidyl-prolyl cis-trans isomerase pin4 n=1 Tax=Tieghemiomyces parasiticus TaxID=78921 RepID=A0A9W8DR18_9FUNG|nr:Peptidyl-prolyl cis-trans isomerase pin4 [Tieghemiomyces parasiticus]
MSTLQNLHDSLDHLSLGETPGSNPEAHRGRPLSVHFSSGTDLATTLGGTATSAYPASAGYAPLTSSAGLAAELNRAASKRDKRRSMQLPLQASALATHPMYPSPYQMASGSQPLHHPPLYSPQLAQFPGMPANPAPVGHPRPGRSRPPSKSMSFPMRPPTVGGQYHLRHHMPLHTPQGPGIPAAGGYPAPLPGYYHMGLDPSMVRPLPMTTPAADEIPTAVVIKNIDFTIKREVLLQTIAMMDIPMPYALNYHYEGGLFRGLAFANFRTPEETMVVIAHLNGLDLAGRKLKVEYKRMLSADAEAAKQEARLAHRNSISGGVPPALDLTRRPSPSAAPGESGSTPTSATPIKLDDPITRECYDQIAAFRHDKARRELELDLPSNEAYAVMAAIAERFGLTAHPIYGSGARTSPTAEGAEPASPPAKVGVRLVKPAETPRTDAPRARHNRYSIAGAPTGNVPPMPKPNRGRLTSESHAQHPMYAGFGGYGVKPVGMAGIYPGDALLASSPYAPVHHHPHHHQQPPLVDEYGADADSTRSPAGRFRSVSFSVGPRPVSGATGSGDHSRIPTASGSPSTPTSSSPASAAFQGYPARMLNAAVVAPTRQPRGPDLSQNFSLRTALLHQMSTVGLAVDAPPAAAPAHHGHPGYYAQTPMGHAGAFM